MIRLGSACDTIRILHASFLTLDSTVVSCGQFNSVVTAAALVQGITAAAAGSKCLAVVEEGRSLHKMNPLVVIPSMSASSHKPSVR